MKTENIPDTQSLREVLKQPLYDDKSRTGFAGTLEKLTNTAAECTIGSADKKQYTISKACGELVLLATSEAGVKQPLRLDFNNIPDNLTFGTHFTPALNKESAEQLFGRIQHELCSRQDKTISPGKGHQREEVNLMLAALHRLYHATNAESQQRNIAERCLSHFCAGDVTYGYQAVRILENIPARYHNELDRIILCIQARMPGK